MKKIFVLFALSSISLSIYAQYPACDTRFAIQSAIVTGGNFGIGIARYTMSSEMGLNVSGVYNTANFGSRLFVPVVYAGFRQPLGEFTFFAYGLDLGSKFGVDQGLKVQADIFVGPYISLEQQLSTHLLLVGWVNPYSYEYEKFNGGTSSSTHRFFNSGGFGLSYMF